MLTRRSASSPTESSLTKPLPSVGLSVEAAGAWRGSVVSRRAGARLDVVRLELEQIPRRQGHCPRRRTLLSLQPEVRSMRLPRPWHRDHCRQVVVLGCRAMDEVLQVVLVLVDVLQLVAEVGRVGRRSGTRRTCWCATGGLSPSPVCSRRNPTLLGRRAGIGRSPDRECA